MLQFIFYIINLMSSIPILRQKGRTKALPDINVCSLPLDVYVDTRLEGDREPVVIYRDAFNV